jgi:hypothetical protein
VSDLNNALFKPKAKAIPFNVELSPAEQTEIANASVLARQEQAKALLRKGSGVDAIMNATSLLRREVHRLMGEVRLEQPPPKVQPQPKAKAKGRSQ